MGRPTKYDSEICDKLPAMFSNGESIAEVCVQLKISKETFYRWKDQYPEFHDAIKEGITYSEAFWTKLGRQGASCEVDIQPTVWIFNMKNRFKWRDKPADEEQSADLSAVYKAIADKLLNGNQ